MSTHSLLSLDLRAPLVFSGIENPPLRGAPLEARLAFPDSSGGLGEIALGLDLTEGEEELFAFEADSLVVFNPDEGPRIHRPLAAPSFYGRRTELPGATAYYLPCGAYIFLQFRPSDDEELVEAFEWFAREAWWEGSKGRGPFLLRRLREEGKLAAQLLRLK